LISESILQGERVRLRPVEESDLPRFIEWLNDPEVRYWLSLSEAPELTLEDEEEWYERTRASDIDLVWMIEAEGEPLGTVGLHGIDERQGRATLGIFIGVKGRWAQGLGTEAIGHTLRFAFGELALRRVDLQVDEDNERGIRCYEKCGFQREGLLRAFRLRLGEPVSCYSMSALREEWEGQPWK
jgi:RimJ/RimL family protein N-acetyltransferase